MTIQLRDPISGLTHFVGTLLAAIGLIALLTLKAAPLPLLNILSLAVFGGAMIMLYLVSTLYHWLPLSGKNLEFMRKIDHIMIFVFIAASYTPICLITLQGVWGWSIFTGVWGLTVAGFFLKLFWLNAPRVLYTAIYLFMGWIIVVAIWPLTKVMLPAALFWMTAGGVFYTAGAAIYAAKRPNPWPDIFGFHEIFHIFIMLGSASHFWLVFKYIK